MDTVSSDIFDQPVEGLHLSGGRLRDQFRGAPKLLVFLRHLGCMFCKEMVRDLRRAVESAGRFPRPVFVFPAGLEQGRAFFDRHWPGASAIADPETALYKAFKIRRAQFGQMAGLPVWGCAVRAMVKGNTNHVNPALGDPWLMPGLFLLNHRGVVLWQHQFRHIGDHPKLDTLPGVADVADDGLTVADEASDALDAGDLGVHRG